MATQIAEAYVQIKPSLKGIKNELSSQMEGEGSGAGESFGSAMVGKLKGVLAAAGIGSIVKEALDAGGALQQSFGGLDTLYGDASDAAKQYSREAAAAGISMNDYAEQAVSFGASLKAAFAGDTTKAVEAANTAILDMADNAAKMGTPLESIQNAYQGFAKGQYNMLDNLKLGYGGTKTEMERLLKDAEKLPSAMGKKFDLDNLGDVYEAIHLVQEDLGLTGVAAAEASETFTGSFGAMKAAATNLMADITTGQDISDDLLTLFDSGFNFVQHNLGPMVANLLKGMPEVLSHGLSAIIRGLNIVGNNASEFVNQGMELVSELVNGILADIPYIIESGIRLIAAFAKALIEYDWIGLAQNFISEFTNNMDLAAGEILGADDGLLAAVVQWIAATLPQVWDKGVELILNLVDGIISNLPAVVEGMSSVIANMLATIASHLPELVTKGFEIITKLVVGLIQAIPKLIAALPEIFKAIKSSFEGYDWKTLGKNILEGIKNGILNSISAVIQAAKEAAKSIYDTVKDFFKIGSPSKLMEDLTRWIPEGAAIGIEGNLNPLNRAVDEMNSTILTPTLATKDLTYSPARMATNSDNNLSELVKAINANNTNVTVTLEGDARKLFKAVQKESNVYYKTTGQGAFAT